MSRRIWIAEGYASDGDLYGRALQLPDGRTQRSAPAQPGGAADVQRTRASVIKSNLGDIASCPCLDVAVLRDDEAGAGPRSA